MKKTLLCFFASSALLIASPAYGLFGFGSDESAPATQVSEGEVNSLLANLGGAIDGGAMNIGALQSAVDEAKAMLPSLKESGYFDKQKLTQWLSSAPANESKVLMAALYLQKYSEALTPEMKTAIRQASEKVSPVVKGYLTGLM